jgi:hypothetical protein
MLDLIGTLFGAAAIGIVITAVADAVTSQMRQRLTFAAVAAAWVGFAAFVAAIGALANPLVLLVLFLTPLVVTGGVVIGSRAARARLLAVPTPLLLRLNGIRMAGALFLALAGAGRLAGPFPESAGWGDIITGAAALPLAALAERGVAPQQRLMWIWNVFGTLDLVVAVTLGVLSADGSPLQLIHAGVGSAAMQSLPWSLVPTVLVPFFLISHGVVFAQLRRSRSGEPGGVAGAVQNANA